jgi:hypothetical protein
MPKLYLDTGRTTAKIKYDSVEISGKFIQVYDDLYPKLLSLSPCAIHLLFWMADNMGDYNQIVLNKNARSEFRADVSGKYKDSTIKASISLLTTKDLIVNSSEIGKRESLYFVNPFHFWKTGSQKDRAESIKGFLYKLKENETN